MISISLWQIVDLCFHHWGIQFQVHCPPLQVKANCGLHSAANEIKRKALVTLVVCYHLATFNSSSYWNFSMSGTAAFSSDSPLLISSLPSDFCTGHKGLLKVKYVLLITPWISRWWISSWMWDRESKFEHYCCWYTVLVATCTWCSSTCNNPTMKGFSEKPCRVDICLILSVFTVATPEAHQ